MSPMDKLVLRVWSFVDRLVSQRNDMTVYAHEYGKGGFSHKVAVALKYLLALEPMLRSQITAKRLSLENNLKILWLQMHFPQELEIGNASVSREEHHISVMERIQESWKIVASFKSFDDQIDNLRLVLHYLNGIFQGSKQAKLTGLDDDDSFGKRYLSLVFNPDLLCSSSNDECELMKQPLIQDFISVKKDNSFALAKEDSQEIQLTKLTRLLLTQNLAMGSGKECKSTIPQVESLLKNILAKGIPIYTFKGGLGGAALHCVTWKIILGAFWLLIAYYRTSNWRRANMYIEQGLKTIKELNRIFCGKVSLNRPILDSFAFEFTCFRYDLYASVDAKSSVSSEKLLRRCAKLATKETILSVILRLGMHSQICQKTMDGRKFAMLCYDYIGVHAGDAAVEGVYAKFLQCLLFSCSKDSRHLVDPSNFVDLVLNVREKLAVLATTNHHFKALLALLEISQILSMDSNVTDTVSFDTRKAKSELLVALQLSQCQLGNHLLTLTVLLFLLDLFKISGDVSQQNAFQKAVSGLEKKIQAFSVLDQPQPLSSQP